MRRWTLVRAIGLWVILAGSLVMLMQAGFAFLDAALSGAATTSEACPS